MWEAPRVVIVGPQYICRFECGQARAAPAALDNDAKRKRRCKMGEAGREQTEGS